ncbi:hypothetical protein GCM10023142_11090 [Anaerocolumna aminovalerica]|uniref:RNA polymerase primary sigma factor n=1 Tax=Anaerocolumna aminovalerica TaxID=1527 RepID=A0A1I5IXV2_9FIRM|nr:sigma-70 family RNA polymerase sigma factor [Anaerocolumna aminovalerica]SFO65404.1 RNA polymerase primary sigma factor [Anaerocolumna aminovalerica]
MSNEELVKEIQKGNNASENMGLLYINNKSYIYTIAKKYIGYADIDDLMQEGYLGLYEAVQSYEESREVLFMTFAGYWIKQSITRYIENNNSCLRLPVHLHSNIYKYKKIVNAYEMQLGRKPTDKELCMHLNLSQKQFEKLKETIYQYANLESLDKPIRGLEDEELSIGDSVSDKTNMEDEIINSMIDNAIKTELWQIVEKNVTPEENKVINYRYKQSLSLRETEQFIGKSREMVRKIEASALRKLRRSRCSRLLQQKFEVNMASAYRGSLSMFKNTRESSTERAALRNLELKGIQ